MPLGDSTSLNPVSSDSRLAPIAEFKKGDIFSKDFFFWERHLKLNILQTELSLFSHLLQFWVLSQGLAVVVIHSETKAVQPALDFKLERL
jgi:hypothetical protein